MYRIARKKALNPTVTLMDVYAPLVAAKALPGQFIILRADSEGERIPLTVAGTDPEKGLVTIIFQIVGATTFKLDQLGEGEMIPDFAGPLGEPTDLEGISSACIVGGGVGCAIAWPIAKALKQKGCKVTGIIGFRTKDLVILEDEFRQCCDKLIVMTDDGSYGEKGNVTQPLKSLLETGERFDKAVAIGPLVMMKFTVLTCRPFNVPVTVSMNPIMIDGTGMCGGCRLTLNTPEGRVTRFACVDGPDFDGYQVDFDEAMRRGRMYSAFERHAYDEACRLFKKEG
ncbi:MAG: sulfide/dihydroorotate dehydrogenase-like FAD/NAD-binding protein [Clostridiales bacterium]|nr:sulfide/dihydroorotate dehydrogenase-like FAD/NAD-binding protein [Clostridiales bacterium]